MIALAFLVSVTIINTGDPPDEPAGPRPLLPDPRKPIALTVTEARRLLTALVPQPLRDAAHALAWSTWRRLHQAATATTTTGPDSQIPEMRLQY